MGFYGFYKIGCFDKTFMGPRVQPGKSLSQKFYIQIAVFQINTVQICDFQFPPGTWFQIFCIFYYFIVIEIKTGHTVVALGLFRFLFNGDSLSFFIEFYDSKTLRIVYIIAEYRCSLSGLCIFNRSFQTFFQTMSGKDIISQNHCHRITSDEVLADNKCLCQTIRTWLYGIRKFNTKLMTVSKQFFESRCVLRCGNDQNLTDTCIHQYRHGIVDHWFIKNRNQRKHPTPMAISHHP